jgi:anti-sigma factor RsiW
MLYGSRSLRRNPVPYSSEHPADWTLELLAEGALAPEEQAPVSAHVEACVRCAAEVDAYRTLFTAMSEMPQFSPAPGFMDAVMAQVTIAKPATLPQWMIRLMPSSWQGWVVLLGLCMAPAAPMIAAVWWIATHPDWSFASLWAAGTTVAQEAGWWLLVNVLGTATESRLAGWSRFLMEELVGMPLEILVIAVLVGAVGVPLSVWTLYRTLRAPSRGNVYAH